MLLANVKCIGTFVAANIHCYLQLLIQQQDFKFIYAPPYIQYRMVTKKICLVSTYFDNRSKTFWCRLVERKAQK